jgi:hypothetical protein
MKTLRTLLFCGLLFTPIAVGATPVLIDTGVDTSIPQIMQGLVDLFLRWSLLIATAIFLMGAALMVGSGGNDAFLSAGKKLMKAALIGLAIVLSSWLILSTIVAFIAG